MKYITVTIGSGDHKLKVHLSAAIRWGDFAATVSEANDFLEGMNLSEKNKETAQQLDIIAMKVAALILGIEGDLGKYNPELIGVSWPSGLDRTFEAFKLKKAIVQSLEDMDTFELWAKYKELGKLSEEENKGVGK